MGKGSRDLLSSILIATCRAVARRAKTEAVLQQPEAVYVPNDPNHPNVLNDLNEHNDHNDLSNPNVFNDLNDPNEQPCSNNKFT